MTTLHSVWDDLVALALPSNCVGCGRNDRLLCRGCQNELRTLAHDPPLTTAPLYVGGNVKNAIPVMSACEYRGLPKRLITAIKHSEQPGLARHVAPLLKVVLRAVPVAGATPVVYVPVPSRASRERERGYRHVDLLLHHAGIRHRMISHVATTSRGRGPQVGNDLRMRRANAARLKLNPRKVRTLQERGSQVVIVDDITTTGASISALAEVLLAANIDVIAAVAVCRVRRLDQRNPKETAKE